MKEQYFRENIYLGVGIQFNLKGNHKMKTTFFLNITNFKMDGLGNICFKILTTLCRAKIKIRKEKKKEE